MRQKEALLLSNRGRYGKISAIYGDTAAGITAEQMKTCLASQQGEEDAVMLYKRMSKKVRDQADREAFERQRTE